MSNNTDRTNYAYTQRNILAIASVKLALLAGLKAGKGIDKDEPSPEWANVVYIDLPDGTQVSWHMAPSEVHLLADIPAYDGVWDGTSLGGKPEWLTSIKSPGWDKCTHWDSKFLGTWGTEYEEYQCSICGHEYKRGKV